MRILYAIQGTGNGHLSRAMDILPTLQTRGQVDVLISGCQADIDVPFDVKYKLHGLSFIFGKRGGIDYAQTLRNLSLKQVVKEISHVPVNDYDLVINDFEPITAWASLLKNVPCYSLSHQSALLSRKVPKPFFKDPIGSLILRCYAPTKRQYGFHFKKYAENIWLPSIRPEVRACEPTDRGYYLVYLPAYSDHRILEIINEIPNTYWYVFSKNCKSLYRTGNAFVRPVDREHFATSLSECRGVLCGAGFETPAEALYLGKKLMVVPMKGQYEQQLNAMALKDLGVPVLKTLSQKSLLPIQEWVLSDQTIQIDFPPVSEHIVNELMLDYAVIDSPLPTREELITQ